MSDKKKIYNYLQIGKVYQNLLGKDIWELIDKSDKNGEFLYTIKIIDDPNGLLLSSAVNGEIITVRTSCLLDHTYNYKKQLIPRPDMNSPLWKVLNG